MGIERELPQTSTRFAGTRQPRISLVDRDFATIRRALLDLIRVRFPNEFKDFSISGIGMAIIEVVAYSHAQISFYVDAHANEFFIPTARTMPGMRRLTAALNYRMRSATAASVGLTAFPSPPQTGKIRLDAGTLFRARNGTVWRLVDTVIIPENSAIHPDPEDPFAQPIIASEGESKTARFGSDGQAFQKFLLPEENVIEGSISVEIGGNEWIEADSLVFSEGFGFATDRVVSDGTSDFQFTLTRLHPRPDNFVVAIGADPNTAEVWEQVEDFLSSGPGDRHYLLTVSPSTGVAEVIFGNGSQGMVPAAGELISFTYNLIGPQEAYQVIMEPDGLFSIRFGDGNGSVIPPQGEEIVVSYKTGGGLRGNIEIGGIDTVIQGRIVLTDEPVAVRVQNQEAGAGAEQPESIDHARLFAPKVAGSTGRAVTVNDYDGLMNSFRHPDFGAPAFAKAELHSEFPESNQVDLAIWTRDSDGRIFGAPEAFRAVVANFIESRADICHLIRHKPGDTIFIDLALDVAIKSTLNVPQIVGQVRSALDNFFLSTQVLPGVDIRRSPIITVVQSIPGVAYTEITGIRLSRRNRSVYFIGDGLKNRFKTSTFHGFDPDLGAPVIPGSFRIIVGEEKVTDDIRGNLVGEIDDGASVNMLVYSDQFKVRSEAVSDGPRFFTPYFAFREVLLSEFPATSVSDEILPDSDVTTIPGTLVVTDGVQHAYDDGNALPSSFEGDVSGPGIIEDDGTGKVKISVTFANPASGPIRAYYVAETPVVPFNFNPPAPVVDQQLVDPLEHPVRPGTAVIRHSQDLVVDNGQGEFVWNQNSSDSRDNANKIIYADDPVMGEDISIWEVPFTGGLRYRGRIRNVPRIPVMSPQIRPGSLLISAGGVEISDDGFNRLVGDNINPSGVNRVFYEDTQVTSSIIAPPGQTVYSGVSILSNVIIPPIHGAAPPHFEIVTQVQDPIDSQFYPVTLRDVSPGATGVLNEIMGPMGPSGPYLVSGSVNYANGTVDVELSIGTTLPLRATYRVQGGTFDFLLSSPFTSPPVARYKRAVGGQFDLTYNGTNAGQPLFIRYFKATGGHFDVALDDIPAPGDLVQVDYRFQYELVIPNESVLSVTAPSTRRVNTQLAHRPIKRGSLIISGQFFDGTQVSARDDGGGVFVGAGISSLAANFVDYSTGVIEVSFASNLLSGSEVSVEYVALLEPEEVVPILNDQMAALASVEINPIDPVDIK
jgi:hypothetical protein